MSLFIGKLTSRFPRSPLESLEVFFSHLVDVKANGQIFTLAVPASGLFWPLLDANQHFIFGLFDIKDVLWVGQRKRDMQ